MNRRNFLGLTGLGILTTISPKILAAIFIRTKPYIASTPHQSSTELFVFYVGLNGNNAWSGKQAQPNSTGTDGPFATLDRARDAIRELKVRQGGTLKKPVTVFVGSGTYYLTEPLVFDPQDSGTEDFPVIYSGYQNDRPVFSGGRKITQWQPVTLHGKLLWTVTIPEVQEGKWFFRQLWVNGKRRRRARHPSTGYFKVAEVPDTNPETPFQEGQKRFKFYKGDLSNWETLTQAEIVVMNFWTESRLPIVSVNEKQKLVTCGKRTIFRMDPGNSASAGAAIYYIENALEILDTPGEWYLDGNSGKLYYMPMPNEDMTTAEVIVPVLSKILDLQGESDGTRFVEYLSFQNLAFCHAEWYYPPDFKATWPAPDVGGFWQAAYGVPGVIYAQWVRYCSWKDCEISHISNYAIEFAQVCQANQIIDCEIFDLGAGGVKISANGAHKIINCHIYDGGLVFHSAVGIWIEGSSDNYIAHNQIHDFYHSGISVGWTWGYEQSAAKGNIIEFNHIHHIGLRSDGDQPLLNDKGGIYTLGVQPGTVIKSNIIHDIQAFNYGAWGIYMDEGSSFILVENNIVYRTRDGSFHLHYGKENIIRNNIFAFGTIAQIRRSRQEPHLSFTFEHNIVYWSEGTLLFGEWADSNFLFDYNLYWQAGGKDIRFGDLSWNEWQTKGKDQNSMIADPLFIAPEQGDFRLNPNSPAFQLGFQPISLPKN